MLAVQNQADASTRATVMLWGADGLIGYRWTDASGVNRSRYHLYDVQGNLAQSLDEAGNVVETAGVTAHGMPLVNGSAFGVGSAFAYGAKFGYYRDGESGFYLCGLRYYDPSAGRWITRDPIGFAGGSNLYGYVENEPTNLTDPSGLRGMSKAQCWQLLQDILRKAGLLVAELAKYNPATDGQGGFPIAASKGGGVTVPGGHYKKILNFKSGIINDVQRYWAECRNCDGGPKGPRVPAWIPKLAHQPVPVPILVPNLTPAQRLMMRVPGSREAWERAGKVAGGIGLAASAAAVVVGTGGLGAGAAAGVVRTAPAFAF